MNAASQWIYDLADPALQPVAELSDKIGGKAASLVALRDFGCLTPDGFVLIPEVCRAYWQAGQQWPEGLADQLVTALERLEQRLGHRFGDQKAPLELAVRSGAAVSMPGTMVTVLHCGRNESLDRDSAVPQWPETSLGRAITEVLDSWNSDAACSYRSHQRIDADLGTAVVIQEMREVSCAGVVFTRDPRDGSHQLVVEAVSGTGDTLVGGETVGTTWRLTREGQLLSNHADAEVSAGSASDQLLSESELRHLSQLSVRLESVQQMPLDIEWGWDGHEFVFFQCRPLKEAPAAGHSRPKSDWTKAEHEVWAVERRRFSAAVEGGEQFFVRHNLAESLPCPTPLTWSLWQQFGRGDGGLGELYRLLGFSPQSGARSVFEQFGGQVYTSTSRMARLYSPDFPFRHDEERLQERPSEISHVPSRLDLDQVGPWFLFRLPYVCWVIWRSARRLASLASSCQREYEDRALPNYTAFLDETQQQGLADCSQEECLARLHRRIDRVMNHFYPQLLIPGTIGAARFVSVEHRLRETLGDNRAEPLVRELWQHIPQPSLRGRQAAIASAGESPNSLRKCLARYGHWGPLELELAAPRWSEFPAALRDYATSLPSDVGIAHASDTSGEQLILRAMEDTGAGALAPPVQADFGVAAKLLDFREEARDQFLRGYGLIREGLQVLAERTGYGEGLYYLTLPELAGLPSESALGRIEQRRTDHSLWRKGCLPTVLTSAEQIPLSTQPGGTMLRGRSICGGTGAGRAVVRRSPLPQEDPCVLVATSLRPDQLPDFSRARAVVVDQGSVLSHGALLAREFGLPVLVVPQASSTIVDGEWLEVDAEYGTVQRSER